MLRSDTVRCEFPLRATYVRQVLPLVVGFPHLRVLCLIRHPSGIRRSFPLTVLLRLPARRCVPSGRLRLGLCVRVSPSVPKDPYAVRRTFPPSGARGASQVLVRFSSCMPRPVDSGGPSHPRRTAVGCSCVAFGERPNPRRPRSQISKLYQLFRARGHPCGLQDSLSTLRPDLVRSPLLPPFPTPHWTQDSIRAAG